MKYGYFDESKKEYVITRPDFAKHKAAESGG